MVVYTINTLDKGIYLNFLMSYTIETSLRNVFQYIPQSNIHSKYNKKAIHGMSLFHLVKYTLKI